MKKLRALIFDLDDTLYPERSYVLSGFRAVAEWARGNLGVSSDQVMAELVDLHDGGDRGDTFDRWLAKRRLNMESLLPKFIEAYRSHSPSIRPFGIVPDMLSRLRASFRLGLVTDGYGGVQRLKLAALGLEGFFDAVVFSDDLGREAWKPSPRPFEAAMRALGTPASEAAYVADNPLKDFWGPRSLGMRTIRVRYGDGYHAKDEPPSPEHAPDVSIDDLSELEGLLS